MSPVNIVILYQYSIHHIVIIFSISINNTTEINSITPSSYVSFFRRIELRVNSSAKVQITIHPQPTSQTYHARHARPSQKQQLKKKWIGGGIQFDMGILWVFFWWFVISPYVFPWNGLQRPKHDPAAVADFSGGLQDLLLLKGALEVGLTCPMHS